MSAVVGLSAERIIEDETGCLFSIALGVGELQGSVEWAIAEFEYQEGEVAAETVRLCRELEYHLDRLSLAPDGTLTLNRECSRCSGAGKTSGEDPCIECGGSGYVHADEADG